MTIPTMRAARTMAARDDGAALRLWAGAIVARDFDTAEAVVSAGGLDYRRDARRILELAAPLRAHVCMAVAERDHAATLATLRLALRTVLRMGEACDVPAATLEAWRRMAANVDAQAAAVDDAAASMGRAAAAGVRYVRDVAGVDALALLAALPAIAETAPDPAAAADAWAGVMLAAAPILENGAAMLDADPDVAALEAARWRAIARQADA